MRDRQVIFTALIIQAFCAGFFIFEILASVTGLASPSNGMRALQTIEIAAALSLLVGLGMGAYALRRTLERRNFAEHQMILASGNFSVLLQNAFREWGLSPAEEDVAMFVIKGMSTKEIAALRETSEGTVKAQTNAIYRKSGLSGRGQLVSYFIEDLMEGILGERASQRSSELVNTRANLMDAQNS